MTVAGILISKGYNNCLMFHEIKFNSNTLDSIWVVDSSAEGLDYTVTPDLGVNLIIKLFPNHSEVVLSGAVTRQQIYPHIPDTRYFGIRFHPGNHCFPHLPSLYELQNTSITLSNQFLNCLEARLREQATQQAQIDELCHSLPTLVKNNLANPTSIQEALGYIHQYQGQITVRELSQMTMLSERQLQRLFKETLGVSPKTACNIVRIREVLQVLWQSSSFPNLSKIALQFGYTDQAHLANDFRRLIGMSISEYLCG